MMNVHRICMMKHESQTLQEVARPHIFVEHKFGMNEFTFNSVLLTGLLINISQSRSMTLSNGRLVAGAYIVRTWCSKAVKQQMITSLTEVSLQSAGNSVKFC